MQKIPTLIFLAILTTNALSISTQAAPNANSSTRSIVQARSSAQESAVAKMPTYAQLRKSLKIDPKITLEVVRADQASYAGRAVEFSGIVTGTMSLGGARTVILNVDNTIVRFAATSEILNGDLLQAGASVRVLALVGQTTTDSVNVSSAVALQPLAVQSAPRTAFVQTSDDPSDTTDTSQASTLYALDQLPPATEIPLVRSSGAPMPNIIRPGVPSSTRDNANRPSASAPYVSNRAPIVEDDSYGTFDQQMPAYRAMVKRFNPRLTPDLVDKIALALLQAGTANGMDPRFLAAIISVESDFDIYCRSDSGAMGLGQLMPFNLSEAHITNAWDPVQNVWGTARLLRGHLNDYRNRADGTLLAVAAYNAGPGAVRRAGYRVPTAARYNITCGKFIIATKNLRRISFND